MPRKMAIFCDETGTHNCAYFGWGSIWCPLDRVGALERAVDRICRAEGCRRELKWSMSHALAARQRALRWFFETPWVCFQSLWVKKSKMRIFRGRSSAALAYRKLLCTMLTTCMERFDALPGGPRDFEVVVDQVSETTRTLTRREFRILTAAAKKRGDTRRNPVADFRRVDSRSTRGIQLADLLAGAIRAGWEGRPGGAKRKVYRTVARHLGWKDLRATTAPNLKFNIWLHWDSIDASPHLKTRRPKLRVGRGDPQRLFDRLGRA